MMFKWGRHVEEGMVNWLTKESPPSGFPLCNFDRLRAELRPCDVLLAEGRGRVSEVIKSITQSPWSHSALYIGRLSQIRDADLYRQVRRFYDGDPEDQLLVESELGLGTVVTPLSRYNDYHLRICRPKGISQWDALKVIEYTVRRLGSDYDVRQLLDLARFLFPYAIVPRRWRSSLFEHNAGDRTRTVCSSLLAQAFMSVNFPILPVVQRDAEGALRLYQRNFRLFTPRDFDQSPYFEIVKYPLIGHDDLANYRNLPWDPEGLICNANGDCFRPGEVPEEMTWAMYLADGFAKLRQWIHAQIGRRFNGRGGAPFDDKDSHDEGGKAEPTLPPQPVSQPSHQER